MFCGLDQVVGVLDAVRVEVVAVPADCQDGFFCAYRRRPEAYPTQGSGRRFRPWPLLDDRVIDPGLAASTRTCHRGFGWTATRRCWGWTPTTAATAWPSPDQSSPADWAIRAQCL
jgi:hypothetical protein